MLDKYIWVDLGVLIPNEAVEEVCSFQKSIIARINFVHNINVNLY